MHFHAPTRVLFGPGTMFLVGEEAARISGGGPLFLVTDEGIVSAGIAARVLSQLKDVTVFDEVEPNPRHSTINRAGGIVRKLKPSLVVGLGGGSALDAAKAVALLASNPGGIEEYEGREKYGAAPLPVLAVPTTCGTGSEVTWVSVVTHTGRKFKMSIKGPRMFPATAVVDPDLLLTLPPPLVASTGMDALTHAVEAFTAKGATPITDLFALEAARLLFGSIVEAYSNTKTGAKARENVMLGSLLAGFAFGNSDVGAVHCIAEAVGSLFDTPHGVANSVFLPWIMEFNLPAARSRYSRLAEAAGIQEGEEEQAARRLVSRVRELSRRLDIPSFKELDIDEVHFHEIAEKSFVNNSNPSNAREMRAADYLEVLQRAASGEGRPS